MRDLLDAMDDSWSKWTTTEGIRNLPETGDQTVVLATPRPSRCAARSSGGSPARGSPTSAGSPAARLVRWKSTKSLRADAGSCVAFNADQSASAS